MTDNIDAAFESFTSKLSALKAAHTVAVAAVTDAQTALAAANAAVDDKQAAIDQHVAKFEAAISLIGLKGT